MFIDGLEKVAVTLTGMVAAFTSSAVDRAIRLGKVHVKSPTERTHLKKAFFQKKMSDALIHADNLEEVGDIKKLYKSEFNHGSPGWWANRKYLSHLRSSLPRQEKSYINRGVVTDILKLQKNMRGF